jgi:predicted Zn-dependent protease
MKRNLILRLRRLALGLPLLFAWGCQTSTEPFTGRKQFIMTSPQEEMRLSLDAWNEVLQKEAPSTDRAKIAAVERVGRQISAVANRPDFDWEFRVLAGETPNAFCLPSGKVAVYEPLFDYVSNDAELAAVIGHEIGHAIARHGGERMTRGILVNLGAGAASLALMNQDAIVRDRWLAAYGGISTIGLILPYSRLHEYAADEIGMMLMAQAGYDPNAAISFWGKFAAKGGAATLEFLSTHPLDQKRIQKLRTILPKAMSEYNYSANRHGLGQVY